MPAEKEISPVGISSIGYDRMSPHWDLIHDLLGGTQAMRDAAETWLPMEPAESESSYETRLGRAILYNGYRDTLYKLANRPFTHPIIVTDLPEEISYLEDDVDGNNKSLETFTKDILKDLINYGIAHIFVDHSLVDEVAEGKIITKAEEAAIGVRVFLNKISPVNLIGWQVEKAAKTSELIQIRIRETLIEADGEFGDVEVNYINVFNRDNWEIWQQDSDEEQKYNLIDSGVHSFGKIALITIYANRKGFMVAEPPLNDLAWLNLAHWQSYSDQRNILRLSRFGLLFGKGLPKAMAETGSLDVGPSKAILVEDPNADLKYVEHNGNSIDAGAKDIEDIEMKMQILGNQPMIKSITKSTATAERIDESRTVSQLQSWVKDIERGMLQVLKYACEWRKIKPPETMEINIYSDFEAAILGGADKDLLLKMKQAGEISSETFLREEQRRGVLSVGLDIDEEVKKVAEESANELKNYLPLEEEDEEVKEIEENEDENEDEE